jgi:hypothetical protein
MTLRAIDRDNAYATAALKTRAHLTGEIEVLKKQLAWRGKQLEAALATLQIFSHDPHDGAKPIKSYRRVYLFKQGEPCRLIRETLRDGKGPMSAPDIAAGVAGRLGHGDTVYPAMLSGFMPALPKCGARGARSCGAGRG